MAPGASLEIKAIGLNALLDMEECKSRIRGQMSSLGSWEDGGVICCEMEDNKRNRPCKLDIFLCLKYERAFEDTSFSHLTTSDLLNGSLN